MLVFNLLWTCLTIWLVADKFLDWRRRFGFLLTILWENWVLVKVLLGFNRRKWFLEISLLSFSVHMSLLIRYRSGIWHTCILVFGSKYMMILIPKVSFGFLIFWGSLDAYIFTRKNFKHGPWFFPHSFVSLDCLSGKKCFKLIKKAHNFQN